jgi:hypothetical protein
MQEQYTRPCQPAESTRWRPPVRNQGFSSFGVGIGALSTRIEQSAILWGKGSSIGDSSSDGENGNTRGKNQDDFDAGAFAGDA